MKHIKLFENNSGKLQLQNAMDEYDKIGKLIRDFINFEGLVTEGKIKDVVYYYYETNVEKVGDKILFVVFGDYEKNRLDVPAIMILNEDEKKLYKFIEDPDLYMNTKKYNM